MTSQFWLRRSTSIWFLYLIATDMITFVCHSWSNNQTCSKGTLMLKRFLACGSWNLIVLLPWYLIRRPISIYRNSYFAWRNKPNETHSFFYSWTVTLCFFVLFPEVSVARMNFNAWKLVNWSKRIYFKLER